MQWNLLILLNHEHVRSILNDIITASSGMEIQAFLQYLC